MEFQRMSEAYQEKHYPQGSVLVKSTGKNRTNSIILIVILLAAGGALTAGILYFLSLIRYHLSEGRGDEATVGYVLIAIFAVFLALCVLGLVFSVKNLHRGVDAIIAASAKRSGLTAEEVRAFDQQAFQSDTCILKLKNAVSAAMANQADGLLTRDYLWLGDAANLIMRRRDVAGACLYQWSYYVKNKRCWCLSAAVVSRENAVISAEVTPESGAALLGLLHRLHPEIIIAPSVLREGKEYDDWRASVTEGCAAG